MVEYIMTVVVVVVTVMKAVVSDDRLMLCVRRIGEVLLSLIHLKACVWWSWCLTVALVMKEPLSLSLWKKQLWWWWRRRWLWWWL